MKLIVKAECQKGGEEFDGLDCGDEFVEYADSNFPKCIEYGYMHFEYDPKKNILYTLTVYETSRKLTKEEEKIVIDYTQGQWSDGIGEGFEQQPFSEADANYGSDFDDDTIYNPSPWYPGQKPWIEYEETNP